MRITRDYDGERVVLETKIDPDLSSSTRIVRTVGAYIETMSGMVPLVYLEMTPLAIDQAGGVNAFVLKVIRQFNEGIANHWPDAPEAPVIPETEDVVAMVEAALSQLVFADGVPYLQQP